MKEQLRRHFLQVRKNLGAERRSEASRRLLSAVLQRPFSRVASFFSMKDEVDLFALNQQLAQERRLLLPKTSPDGLDYYLVTDLKEQTVLQGHYLFEPNPSCCERAILTQEDLLLVPGVAFDAKGGRLGFGKGHYDRFLARHPELLPIGVGFKEQLSEALLPQDAWDRPVHEVLLV